METGRSKADKRTEEGGRRRRKGTWSHDTGVTLAPGIDFKEPDKLRHDAWLPFPQSRHVVVSLDPGRHAHTHTTTALRRTNIATHKHTHTRLLQMRWSWEWIRNIYKPMRKRYQSRIPLNIIHGYQNNYKVEEAQISLRVSQSVSLFLLFTLMLRIYRLFLHLIFQCLLTWPCYVFLCLPHHLAWLTYLFPTPTRLTLCSSSWLNPFHIISTLLAPPWLRDYLPACLSLFINPSFITATLAILTYLIHPSYLSSLSASFT